ncbi:uncharacterized protein BJ212DRAFT_1449524 [Suillus subaureus]|uniref:SH3 domain-containing protein n=1 Tax=Suillus subaureus TaxID=48587 RepID=A0A9P7DY25_9AGAM|nr:uncharacterized protein BJ212DRAFT_1449524 [Suillus subaureus]KAG1805847.1 hypothetical protein BJ212DRAFT_1449524 [Suillus subaureus]
MIVFSVLHYNIPFSRFIYCVDPVCEPDDGMDICPVCFCAGKEFAKHKAGHAYRVILTLDRSYPIFSTDWGADEELLLIEGISQGDLGNWWMIAEHIDVEEHYNSVYVDSTDWPIPRADIEFNIDQDEFQASKRRRMSTMTTSLPPPHELAPTSAPGAHEIATFLPGRLEFEHELDNEAKDLERSGIYENDADVRAWAQTLEERKLSQPPVNGVSGIVNWNGYLPMNSDSRVKSEEPFKLTLMGMHNQRLDKRREAKVIMYERGLLDYKKMQAAEEKRPKEEKDITTEDFVFAADILYESMLRKRIQELQHYQRMGLTTPADIDKFEIDSICRAQAKANSSRNYYSSERSTRESEGRKSHEENQLRSLGSLPERVLGSADHPPLNPANSPSLHLLTSPYLVIKETLVWEYTRRGGKLRRREARDLVKIDVNKTSRV